MIFQFTDHICPVSGKSFETLYFAGGYHSIPDGCTVWGTSVNRTNRFIGDNMGNIVLHYSDGDIQRIPLIFGYTLWYKSIWREACVPFKSDFAEPEYTEALKISLQLWGAFEGAEECCLAVKPKKKPLEQVSIEGNPEKDGMPLFSGFSPEYTDIINIEDDKTAIPFFASHTVDASVPFPEKISALLDKINRRMLTFEEDYANLLEYRSTGALTAAGEAPVITLTGDRDAEIATGVVFANLEELAGRSDNEGFVHTSGKYAPTWWYDGFGPWLMNAGNYYGDYYSRDAGRALLTLSAYGKKEEALRGVEYGNKLMMYFPENHITFNGKNVPGHCTVVMNKPMFYSEILSVSGWPTQYTEERFGKDYQKLGNQETDGHGLMMMANYSSWKENRNKKKWAETHFNEIKESAEWIRWCFENPEISLADKNLLYAESEAGMNAYTLYCNVPCYLGLRGYSEIAASIGEKECSEAWAETADKLMEAITAELSENGKWKPGSFGFFHDPVVTFCADYYGYDLSDMPEKWVALSRAVYEDDAAPRRSLPYDASGGVGYNSSMITQSALLLDRMKDADAFSRRLTRLCYAPRLPNPYIVPEGASYSTRLQAVRRQGDLGNLVQMAEVLKTYHIIFGVSPVRNRKLKIFPRLPRNWELDIKDFNILNIDAKISLKVSYPQDGKQMISLSVTDTGEIDTVTVRFGPFEKSQETELSLNGRKVSGKSYFSGDSVWEEVTISVDMLKED